MKLFLNVSKEEQRRRFLARIDEADRNWKFSAERRQGAGLLGRLPEGIQRRPVEDEHAEWAPWYVVPADDKPFARVAAAGVLAHTLIEIDPRFPTVSAARRAMRSRSTKVELEAEAPDGAAPDPIEVELAEAGQGGQEGHRKGKEVVTGGRRSADPARPEPAPGRRLARLCRRPRPAASSGSTPSTA